MADELELDNVRVDYDAGANVLYIYFGRPSTADDSHVTDEGVVIGTREDRIMGLTILNAKEKIYS